MEVDKIAALKELGFRFYSGRETGLPMLRGAAMNAECKTTKAVTAGDHTLFIAEVVSLTAEDKAPLVYRRQKLFQLAPGPKTVPKSDLKRMEKAARKFRKTG